MAEQLTPLIQQPQAATLSPQQVLGLGLQPIQDAVGQYANEKTAIARNQLNAAMELGMQKNLLAQRLEGEKDIAQWHERAAQIRSDAMEMVWDARAKEAEIKGHATADRMADAELERQNRDIIGRITSLRGKIPDFTASDTPQTKYAKLSGALQSAIDGHNKADAQAIIKLHTQLDTIDQEHEAQAKNAANVSGPRALYQMLSQSQNPQDQAAVQTLNDMQAGKWVNPQTGKKMPPMSFAAAVDAAGLGQTYMQLHQQLQDQTVATLQQKDTRRANVLAAYDGFAKLNPDAFQSAAQSIVSAQVPPSPTKSFEEQLRDAAKGANGGQGAAPTQAATRNPFMLPQLSNDDVGLVKDLVPHAEHLAMQPDQVIGLAKAAADKKVGQLTQKLNDIGATIGPDGKVTVNPQEVTTLHMQTGGYGIPVSTVQNARNRSPEEMLANSTQAVKLRDQLSEATQQQSRLAQIISMANNGQGDASQMSAPNSVIGLQQQAVP